MHGRSFIAVIAAGGLALVFALLVPAAVVAEDVATAEQPAAPILRPMHFRARQRPHPRQPCRPRVRRTRQARRRRALPLNQPPPPIPSSQAFEASLAMRICARAPTLPIWPASSSTVGAGPGRRVGPVLSSIVKKWLSRCRLLSQEGDSFRFLIQQHFLRREIRRLGGDDHERVPLSAKLQASGASFFNEL